MMVPAISRKAAAVAAAIVLAFGMVFASAAPAEAECNSTEVWVEVLGSRIDSPTNGCVGPSDWGLLICTDGDTGFVTDTVVVGAGACIALPA